MDSTLGRKVEGEFFIMKHFKCWLTSQGERTNRTRKLILCDGSSDTYYSTETPACIYVRTFLTASEKDVSISCTPREQICKSCTPDAAGLISCARQNWSVHANHAGKFSVHAEDLPENVHTFQTDFSALFWQRACNIHWHNSNKELLSNVNTLMHYVKIKAFVRIKTKETTKALCFNKTERNQEGIWLV